MTGCVLNKKKQKKNTTWRTKQESFKLYHINQRVSSPKLKKKLVVICSIDVFIVIYSSLCKPICFSCLFLDLNLSVTIYNSSCLNP